MFDHCEIKVTNFPACKTFYEAALAPLGIEIKWSDDAAAGFGQVGNPIVAFLIESGPSSTPAHIAFSAADEAAVHAFHAAGVEAGGSCNGEPGLRKHYAPNYYAAFLKDPSGNNIEALFRAPLK